jgi:sugar lactone lactonase YvrE
MKKCEAANTAALGMTCGEAPVWIPEENTFYFVETEERELYSYSVGSGTIERYPVPFKFQCLARREKGGWIGTVQNGVALWNPDDNSAEFIGNPEQGRRGMFFNDGTVTPGGDFIFGTFDLENLEKPNGSIYIVDSQLKIALLEPGFAVPNGMAFGLDGTTLYVSEQFGKRILLFDWDPAAKKLGNRRTFTEFTEEQGLPDGLIIDSEGYVWVANWWGWKVTRFDPDGAIDMEIPLPVTTATCMVFAGKNMDLLYITTARKAVDEEDLKKGPEAGDLFVAEPGCTGRLENKFKG